MNELNPISKTKTKILTEDDLRLQELLMDDLRTMQAPIPYVEDVVDKDLSEGLSERMERESGFTNDFSAQLDMMVQLFESNTVEEMTKTADDLLSQTKTQYNENQKLILGTIRPWETTLRSLDLFFKNASSSGKVENAAFITVDPQRFAGADNTKHYMEFAENLKDLFYAWQVDGSPMFITYVGDIGDGADLLAEIAQETIALAVVDTLDCSSPDATLKRTRNRKLRGVESRWGHLVVSGTHLIGRGAYEELETDPLAVPSACAIVGKLMSGQEGSSIAGFENGALKGAKGVRYKSDARHSKKFGEQGMLIIGWEDGTARIFGDGTANQSDNPMLRKVSQMVVHNKVMKDLVGFCNKKAFSKWGGTEKRKFKDLIEEYLNDLIRDKVIQGYEDVVINDLNEDEVSVSVGLKFYKTISRYLISIGGENVKKITT